MDRVTGSEDAVWSPHLNKQVERNSFIEILVARVYSSYHIPLAYCFKIMFMGPLFSTGFKDDGGKERKEKSKNGDCVQ